MSLFFSLSYSSLNFLNPLLFISFSFIFTISSCIFFTFLLFLYFSCSHFFPFHSNALLFCYFDLVLFSSQFLFFFFFFSLEVFDATQARNAFFIVSLIPSKMCYQNLISLAAENIRVSSPDQKEFSFLPFCFILKMIFLSIYLFGGPRIFLNLIS